MRYTAQPSFELGPEITQEQLDFFDQHGFIHFRNVASDEEVDAIIQAMDEMEHQFISEDREFVMGVPIQWGVDHSNCCVETTSFGCYGRWIQNDFAYSNGFVRWIDCID